MDLMTANHWWANAVVYENARQLNLARELFAQAEAEEDHVLLQQAQLTRASAVRELRALTMLAREAFLWDVEVASQFLQNLLKACPPDPASLPEEREAEARAEPCQVDDC